MSVDVTTALLSGGDADEALTVAAEQARRRVAAAAGIALLPPDSGGRVLGRPADAADGAWGAWVGRMAGRHPGAVTSVHAIEGWPGHDPWMHWMHLGPRQRLLVPVLCVLVCLPAPAASASAGTPSGVVPAAAAVATGVAGVVPALAVGVPDMAAPASVAAGFAAAPAAPAGGLAAAPAAGSAAAPASAADGPAAAPAARASAAAPSAAAPVAGRAVAAPSAAGAAGVALALGAAVPVGVAPAPAAATPTAPAAPAAASASPVAVPSPSPATSDAAASGGTADGVAGEGPASDGTVTAAEVARLYEEAARASATYEHGRRAARDQRVKALRLERLLAEKQRQTETLRAAVGRIARAQYRAGGGGIAYTAKLLLADDPQELMEGHRLAWRADLAVSRMLDRAVRAERRLVVDERLASAAWRDLDARTDRLEEIKQGITVKLEDARWKLQGEADRKVSAGRCAGAVRLEEQGPPTTRAWVRPVEQYVLSAGFGGVGARWANRHTGQDFAVDIGTPVRAVGAGRVVSVSCGGAFGIEVVVGHPDGYYTQYAHLAGVMVDQGELVRTGQWIGQAGTTGNSSGPHLHFEVRLTPYVGSGIDPAPWMRERGAGF